MSIDINKIIEELKDKINPDDLLKLLAGLGSSQEDNWKEQAKKLEEHIVAFQKGELTPKKFQNRIQSIKDLIEIEKSKNKIEQKAKLQGWMDKVQSLIESLGKVK